MWRILIALALALWFTKISAARAQTEPGENKPAELEAIIFLFYQEEGKDVNVISDDFVAMEGRPYVWIRVPDQHCVYQARTTQPPLYVIQVDLRGVLPDFRYVPQGGSYLLRFYGRDIVCKKAVSAEEAKRTRVDMDGAECFNE